MLEQFLKHVTEEFWTKLDFWLAFGMVFQAMFAARFMVQWIASERHKKSVIPISFWYLSLAGGLGVLIYGIARVDLVIISGQAFNSVIYLRNLMFIYRERRSVPPLEKGGA